MSASNVEKEPGPVAAESPAASTPGSEPEKKKREYKDFAHEQEKATREFKFHYSRFRIAAQTRAISRRQC